MNSRIGFSIGILTLTLIVGMFWAWPNVQSEAVAQRITRQTQSQTVDGFEYGRLIFDEENYNWIAGDSVVLRPTSARNLITRLGGRAQRFNFATLLDTLGSQGWELIFETEDPEGFGKVLIFKRPSQ